MSEIEKYYNGEIHVDFEEDKPLLTKEIESKNKVITILLKRIAILEREVEKHEGF